MRTIHKFTIERLGELTLQMPTGAEPLVVQMQRERACVWAIVDDQAALEEVGFFVAGTGHALPDELGVQQYIGTFQHDTFVWHLFRWPKGGTNV
jgi:hypothetical protein